MRVDSSLRPIFEVKRIYIIFTLRNQTKIKIQKAKKKIVSKNKIYIIGQNKRRIWKYRQRDCTRKGETEWVNEKQSVGERERVRGFKINALKKFNHIFYTNFVLCLASFNRICAVFSLFFFIFKATYMYNLVSMYAWTNCWRSRKTATDNDAKRRKNFKKQNTEKETAQRNLPWLRVRMEVEILICLLDMMTIWEITNFVILWKKVQKGEYQDINWARVCARIRLLSNWIVAFWRHNINIMTESIIESQHRVTINDRF